MLLSLTTYIKISSNEVLQNKNAKNERWGWKCDRPMYFHLSLSARREVIWCLENINPRVSKKLIWLLRRGFWEREEYTRLKMEEKNLVNNTYLSF